MNNDELKKKIAQIIADYFCPQRNEHKNLWGDDRLCYSKMNFAECERVAECTDALIAAGIGDVKTAQEIGASATAMAVLEAAKAEHRAEVAERALEYACLDFATCYPSGTWNDFAVEYADRCRRQAERILKEESKDD